MPTRVKIQHTSRYEFDCPVRLGPHVVRLHPAPHTPARIHEYDLIVTVDDPVRSYLHWQLDALNNWVARVVVPQEITFLQVDVGLEVELIPYNPFDFFVGKAFERYPFQEKLERDLLPFRKLPAESSLVREFQSSYRPALTTVDTLVAVNQWLSGAIRYRTRDTPGVQSCDETIRLGTGSCRDMAWLLVQLLRTMGFAARFVSGYLVQLTSEGQEPPTSQLSSEKNEDRVDYHAWTEVYLPGAGWIGLDATSGYFASECHIPLAFGISPERASPISGTHSAADSDFEHSLSVNRVNGGEFEEELCLVAARNQTETE